MESLDNRLVEPYFPPAYYAHMAGKAFRDRVNQALTEQGMTKAELSRRSRVPYHALDKFLKGASQTTSAENAVAIARCLGIVVDDSKEYDELRSMFLKLPEEQKQAILAMVRGLAK